MPFYLHEVLSVRKNHFPLTDVLVNLFLFTPLAVLHYHATCLVYDILLCYHFPTFGPCLLFVGGIALIFTFAYYQARIPKMLQKYIPCDDPNCDAAENELNRKFYIALFSRTYTFLITFISLGHMKAVTDLFLQASEGSLPSSMKAIVTSTIILISMRAVKNLLGPPLTLTIDNFQEEDFHEFATAFNTAPSETPENAVDVIATIGIVYSMIHLHWAGVTSLLDNILYPNDYFMSAISSIIIGYIICLISLSFQFQAKRLSAALEREKHWKKLAFEDAYILFGSFGVITAWRGIWMTFDSLSFHYPIHLGGFDSTAAISFLLSYLILSMAKLTQTLPYKGFDKDGIHKEGEGCVYNTDYFLTLVEEIKDFIEDGVDDIKEFIEDGIEEIANKFEDNDLTTKEESADDLDLELRKRKNRIVNVEDLENFTTETDINENEKDV